MGAAAVINGSRLEPPRRLDRVIAWRLAEHAHRLRAPLPESQLRRWIRLQWPRILPEAIGRTLCRLAGNGLVTCDERGWYVRPPESRTTAAREHRNGWNPQDGITT